MGPGHPPPIGILHVVSNVGFSFPSAAARLGPTVNPCGVFCLLGFLKPTTTTISFRYMEMAAALRLRSRRSQIIGL
ncbi:hypothetical protein OPV22_000373 [Ensete ventricosum]|uniref:Uncharacterized protein n=1 Tax=Ensete ventricosum TaxID=4639 RepID=A0AAV8RU71_ENSVE|nr:hypothetical protein OPV22_000373 [Ensete ventricosum]